LDLDINKEYQIQLVNLQEKNVINDLEISAQLYAEIYEHDQELRELTQVSCINFME
jgi:hypothetical protein